MTTGGVTEPRDRAGAVGAVRPSHWFAAQGRRTATTVPVMPLWERPREGACR